MTQMREFREYAINGREKYWKVERADGLGSDSLVKWTLTLHEPHCRYAKHEASGRTRQDHYRTEEGLGLLARNGFAVSGPYIRLVWQGCKVCGTFHREPEFKALAAAELDSRRQAAEASRAARRAKDAKDAAARAKSDYVLNKQQAFYADTFKEEVDAAMAAVAVLVAEEWTLANPELAALLTEDPDD